MYQVRSEVRTRSWTKSELGQKQVMNWVRSRQWTKLEPGHRQSQKQVIHQVRGNQNQVMLHFTIKRLDLFVYWDVFFFVFLSKKNTNIWFIVWFVKTFYTLFDLTLMNQPLEPDFSLVKPPLEPGLSGELSLQNGISLVNWAFRTGSPKRADNFPPVVWSWQLIGGGSFQVRRMQPDRQDQDQDQN